MNLSAPAWMLGRHCPELDGVRGCAVLLVTLYRFISALGPQSDPWLGALHRFAPIGERGVDLFFVLSGFLITGILLRTRGEAHYFRNFMMRRALRIFPLYFAALALALVVLPWLTGTTLFERARDQQFYLWTYTSNLRMSWVNEWCFGPLDHFWSLCVEEHFYLVWPLVVFLLSPRALLRLCVGMIMVVGAARVVAATVPAFDVAVDVCTLFRADAIAFGALLAVALQQGLRVEALRRFAKLALPLLLLAAVFFAVTGKRWLTIPSSVCPAIWAILLGLIVTGSGASLLSRVMRMPLLTWLGKYSYGMYVVQLPLAVLLPSALVLPHLWGAGIHASALGYVALMCGITAALAVISFHVLEEPFLRLKRYF
jgi:peptidoglycan/LPS O-acetylase OafA/YrhL